VSRLSTPDNKALGALLLLQQHRQQAKTQGAAARRSGSSRSLAITLPCYSFVVARPKIFPTPPTTPTAAKHNIYLYHRIT
jgi:hypothetical protein